VIVVLLPGGDGIVGLDPPWGMPGSGSS